LPLWSVHRALMFLEFHATGYQVGCWWIFLQFVSHVLSHVAVIKAGCVVLKGNRIMFMNLIIAAFLMAVTTSIHATGMMLAIKLARIEKDRIHDLLRRSRGIQVSIIIVLMFLVSVAEVLVWAVTYLILNALDGFERALYFSMVTYTTLGYGDISLCEKWRLLSSFEAVNGIIMFGWTTAIVMTVVHRIYFGGKILELNDAA